MKTIFIHKKQGKRQTVVKYYTPIKTEMIYQQSMYDSGSSSVWIVYKMKV